MSNVRFRFRFRVPLAIAALVINAGASAAASLDTWVGVIAGVGNGNLVLNCTTFGPPASMAFFFNNNPYVEPGTGVADCGYSGMTVQTTTASGPLMRSGSLSLGSPGSSDHYDGTATAVADFGRLGAVARSNIYFSPPGSALTLYESVGASRFSDTLLATSSLVASGSAGTIRYAFNVDGQLAAPGAIAPYNFGETYVALLVQQNTGPVYSVMNAQARRGEVGRIQNGLPLAGWTVGIGSVSGGSTFYSFDLPMTWGQSFDLKVGLLAFAYGTADADFLSTARLSGVTLMDSNGAVVNSFSLTSASGTNYVSAVAEPGPAGLLLAGLGVLGWCLRRQSSQLVTQ